MTDYSSCESGLGTVTVEQRWACRSCRSEQQRWRFYGADSDWTGV
ncbi:MAG: hypothetical protein OXC99_07800 [Chloroflexi bacterium]|nr:hypothetical protein [Chloroflexota bacterium]